MSANPQGSAPGKQTASAAQGTPAGGTNASNRQSNASKPGGSSQQRSAKRPANGARPKNKGQRRQSIRPVPRSRIRRARLVVQRIDTWSVAKMVFLLSMALGIVTIVASVILWLFLQASGAFTGVNQILTSMGTGNTNIDITQMVNIGQVALATTILSVINTVIFTLLSMIGAILYNLAAKLVGGITLTLSDES
ncbi:DUF3566 domain-containing protein [Rothia dentocariosa]|jgi:integral membrane protein